MSSPVALSLSIQLLHLDQPRIPMYRMAAPWVVGGLQQASSLDQGCTLTIEQFSSLLMGH
ncbi:MAG TPA: hypothetical protein QF683_18270 [SAR324 cluster bacterium]|nr:hypothetical protein [SAR324 cluster bacterium]